MNGLQVFFAVLLLLGNGFFVGAEFALVSVRRSQIEPLAEGEDDGSVDAATARRARTVLYALENLSRMMAAAQLGITVCSLLLGAVAEPAVSHLLEPVWRAVGLPGGLVHPFSYLVALLLVVAFHMVIGEMVPKNMALAAPEKAALRLGPALAALARVLRPVIAVCNGSANLVLRLFRVEPKDEVESVFSAEELTLLLQDSREAGLLRPGQQERLEDALELGRRPVREVVLPMDRLVAVDESATPRDIELLVAKTGFSRYPVVGGDGVVRGYVHVKDVLEMEADGGLDAPIRQSGWRSLLTLPAGLPLDDALGAMRRAAAHLAVVADGDGSALGVAMLEDVLEELVGEVHDPSHRADG
ncbi:hemolysin family protein [Phaeacidiphilus oryzae]|uniref:hemolysin family protein n=1 Tax=Phaeacidiphilus oryzae TaxID=348818 RepID=UPI000559C29A|nr:hemolysin family protein [Phaeacidiphilus oryzae]